MKESLVCLKHSLVEWILGDAHDRWHITHRDVTPCGAGYSLSFQSFRNLPKVNIASVEDRGQEEFIGPVSDSSLCDLFEGESLVRFWFRKVESSPRSTEVAPSNLLRSPST